MHKLKTFIIDSDENSRELIQNYANELECLEISDVFNSIENAYEHIIKEIPNLVIVDITKNQPETLKLIEKITTQKQQIKFVVTALSYDTDSIIKAMRAGAREFLPKPIIKDDFVTTINKLNEQTYGREKTTNCKVITIFSNKGGIGKTSISTNLALEIANITKEKVALVDMNFQLGDVATFMDIKPSFDISYVVKNLDIYNSVCFKCLYCCWRNIKLVFYYLHINNRFINKCTHKPVLSFRFFLIYAYKFLCLFSINQKADRLFLLMSDLVLNRNNRL